MASLGIDIGASKIGFAVLEAEKVIAKGSIPTITPTLEKVTESLRKIKEGLQNKRITLKKIGVAVPGNPQDGTLAAARNFPALVGFPLAEEVEKIFGIMPAALVNDAFAFTYAEAKRGAGKSFKNVVGITLGSGLGSGYMSAGRLYIKEDWSSIRQAILNVKNGIDAEDRASEKFFKSKGIEAKESADQAKGGNPASIKIWQEFGQNLGGFLTGVEKTLHPQVIILGGGIANDFALFAETAKQEVGVPVLKGELGPAAGAIGAALLAG